MNEKVPVISPIQSLFCHIRKVWVKKTPEEEVRQALLQKMLCEWGYPASCIVVEKSLSELPHLAKFAKLPRRRMDIICFAARQSELFPLLVIECKQGSRINKSCYLQLLGYNYYVGAEFAGIAVESKLEILRRDSTSSSLRFLDIEPTYESLIATL
jgi:hypothetical protein